MAKGKTKSKLSLKQRREQAFRKFSHGESDMEVARSLKVSRKTAANYRRLYEESIEKSAVANPTLLQDVLKNTIRSLAELDQIRADAWQRLDSKPRKVKFDCSECGEQIAVELDLPPTDQARVQYQNVLLKAQDQRSKLYGVMGVKADVLVLVMNVKTVQDKLLEWLQRNLEGVQREALAHFMETELSEYLGAMGELPSIIDVESEEVFVQA